MTVGIVRREPPVGNPSSEQLLEAVSAGGEIHAGKFLTKRRRTYLVRAWWPFLDTVELANFVAVIVEERQDGPLRNLVIIGFSAHGDPLPEALVRADRFTGMRWVIPTWGPCAIVTSGKSALLAEAIQRISNVIRTGDSS